MTAGHSLAAGMSTADPWARMQGTVAGSSYTYRIMPLLVLPTLQVDFGELFVGESATRCVSVINNGPAETRFDLSYGSTLDMKGMLGDDDAGAAGAGGADDDSLAAFLQVSRVRVRLGP